MLEEKIQVEFLCVLRQCEGEWLWASSADLVGSVLLVLSNDTGFVIYLMSSEVKVQSTWIKTIL